MAAAKGKIPLGLIVLDAIGTVLIALGIFGLVSPESGFLAAVPQVRRLAIAALIAGALLAMPLIIFLIQRATSAGR